MSFLLQMLAVSSMPFVDTFFLALIDSKTLVSCTFATSLSAPLLFFCVALLNGVKIYTASHHKNDSECNAAILNGIYLAGFLGLFIFVLFFVSAPYLGWLLNDPSEIKTFIPFIKIYTLSFLPALIFVSIREGNLGLRKLRVITYLPIIGGLTNTIMDYYFVFLNDNQMISAQNGIAISTVLAYSFMGFGALVVFLKENKKLSLRINVDIIKKIYEYGIFQGIKRLIDYVSAPIILFFINKIGITEASLYVVLMRFLSFSFFPITSIGEATSVVVGQNSKHQTLLRVWIVAKQGLRVLALYLFVPVSLLYLFTKEYDMLGFEIPEHMSLSILFIMIIIYQICISLETLSWGILRGLRHTKSGFKTSLLSVFIIPIVAAILIFNYEINGIFAILVGEILAKIINIYIYSNARSTIKLVNPPKMISYV